MENNKVRNKNFYDEYKYFDFMLAENLKSDEDEGVNTYISKMEHCVVEAWDYITEWESTLNRLKKIRERFISLKNAELSFDDFQGKDEDIAWMRIFLTKLESKSDPLSKYANLNIVYKTRKKSIIQRIMELFQ